MPNTGECQFMGVSECEGLRFILEGRSLVMAKKKATSGAIHETYPLE